MSEVNFRIIEGEYDGFDFEELCADWLNPNMTLTELCEKYDMSKGKYFRLKARIVEATGVKSKPYCTNTSKHDNDREYISLVKWSSKYRVSKWVDGRCEYFGEYKTLNEARYVRDSLILHDWDKEYYSKYLKRNADSEREFDEFSYDWLNGMSGKDLMEKYGLTNYKYRKLSAVLREKHSLNRKPQHPLEVEI